MKCYECNVEVEAKAYPYGECPKCGLNYTLPDDDFPTCYCGNIGGDPCLDCLIKSS